MNEVVPNLWKLDKFVAEGVIHLKSFKFPDLNGNNATISGPNGSGKSLLSELLGLALNPKETTRRNSIIAPNKDKATLEVSLIKGDSVMEIKRSWTLVEGKEVAQNPTVKIDGVAQNKPASILSSLVSSHSLNITNIAKDPNSLRDLILGKYKVHINPEILMVKYGVDVADYKIPSELWKLHALLAIDELTCSDANKPGILFAKRATINDDRRRLEKTAETVKQELPAEFDADYAEALNISEISEKLADLRKTNEKVEKAKESLELATESWNTLSTKKKELSDLIVTLDTQSKLLSLNLERVKLLNDDYDAFPALMRSHAMFLSDVEKAISGIALSKTNAVNDLVNAKAKLEEIGAQGAEAKKTIATLKVESTETYEKAIKDYDSQKSYLSSFKRMEQYLKEAEELKLQSNTLTSVMTKLNGEVIVDLVASVNAPIIIKDSKLCIKNEHGNVVPIEDLSDAQKVIEYLDILKSIEESFGTIIIEEGRADFDQAHKAQFELKIGEMENAGWQILKLKSSDEPLKVIPNV